MKDYFNNLLQNWTPDIDKFDLLRSFYREKNTRGFGLFSTFAGESFPDRWYKAIEENHWPEQGEYGDNFRKAFNISKS